MNKDMENNHDKRERLNNFELCMVHSRRLKYAMILREKPPYSLRKKYNNLLPAVDSFSSWRQAETP